MRTLPLILVLAAPLIAADAPKLNLKYGADTTRAAAKFARPDGTIDYVAVVNSSAKLPGTNAAANWVEALGPLNFPDAARDAVATAIGIKFTDKSPSYIRHPMDVDRSADFDIDYFRALDGGVDALSITPWVAKDNEIYFKWMIRNEPAMKKMAEAVRKGRWLIPLVHAGDSSTFEEDVAASIGRHEAYDTIGRLFLIHSAFVRNTGKLDEALTDIETAQRIGVLMTQGSTLTERRAGLEIVRKVQRVMQNIALGMPMNEAYLAKWLERYASFPQPGSPLAALDQTQRFITLDLAVRWAASPQRMLEAMKLEAAGSPLAGEAVQAAAKQRVEAGDLAAVDLTAVLRKVNEHYDALVAAAKGRRFIDRYRATMIAAAKRETVVKEGLSLTSGGADTVTRWFTAVVLGTIEPGVDRSVLRHEITHMEGQMTVAALSLGLYCKKNGGWPESSDLARNPHMRSTPIDIFTEKPLLYRQTPDGFALYSVGENGKDDRGHNPSQGEGVKGDDIVVRAGMADPVKPTPGKNQQ